MRYAVTGPHRLDGEYLLPDHPRYDSVARVVARVVHELGLGGDDEFTTGAAFGVDTIAAAAAWAQQGPLRGPNDPLLRVCVPTGKWHNRAAVRLATRVERVMGGYMARNDRLIEHADVLLAFPATAEEELRSGTWATVRRARNAGIEVRLFPLDSAA